MFLVLSILVLSIARADTDNKPGALVPLEQGTVDRSATATTLKIQPVELSETTNFQKLYGVAGRPDLFVRSHGGLYAVFDQGSYRSVQGRTFIQWPAGTVFHIGQPDFFQLKSSGVRMNQTGSNPPPGIELKPKSPGAPDLRIGAAPVNNLISPIPVDARIASAPLSGEGRARVSAKDSGYGRSSAGPSSAGAPRPVSESIKKPANATQQNPIPAQSSASPTEANAPTQQPSNDPAARSPSKP